MPDTTPTCDSGVRPPDGALSDGVTDYAVGHCGFVVAYPSGRWHDVGRPALDAHTRSEHPARWAEINHARSMSKDG